MASQFVSPFATFVKQHVKGSEGMDLKQLSAALGNVSPAMLSRLRNGSQTIGPLVARRIAKKLGKGEAEREALFNELMRTRSAAPTKPPSNSQWSHDASPHDLGLFVEFREKPVMSSLDGGPIIQKLVGRWLRAGTHYAMLSPFPEKIVLQLSPQTERPVESASQLSTHRPIAITKFLATVHNEVVNAYLELREETLRQVAEEYDFGDPNTYLVEAKAVDARLRLYHFGEEFMGQFPVVGYKLHLKAKHKRHTRFDWSSAPIEDDDPPHRRLLERSNLDSEEREAIEARFYPILQYFDAYTKLPSEAAEIEEFYKTLVSPRTVTQGLTLSPWEPYRPDESTEALLERICKNHLKSIST